MKEEDDKKESSEVDCRNRWSVFTIPLLILGLVLLNIAAFNEFSYNNLLRQIYVFHPKTWPWWYSLNFWILVAGVMGNEFLLKFRPNLRTRFMIPWITLILVSIVFVRYSFLCKELRFDLYYYAMWFLHWPYEHIYRPYIYVPLSDFFFSGTFTWNLLVLPVIIIVLLFGILRFKKKCRPTPENSHEERIQKP